ncbi:MAG: Sua5 family C-terminal domain-containing protein [Christensenellales bacterium]
MAHNIFNLFRECEKRYDAIVIEKLSSDGEEGAVMNRIYKSCEGKIL